jgi:hypothetical protein
MNSQTNISQREPIHEIAHGTDTCTKEGVWERYENERPTGDRKCIKQGHPFPGDRSVIWQLYRACACPCDDAE